MKIVSTWGFGLFSSGKANRNSRYQFGELSDIVAQLSELEAFVSVRLKPNRAHFYQRSLCLGTFYQFPLSDRVDSRITISVGSFGI